MRPSGWGVLRGAIALTVAFLLFPCPGPVALAADQPASSQPRLPPKRWVTFELQNSSTQGLVSGGKAVELGVVLGGVPAGNDPVVALFESTPFQTQQIYLTQDSTPMVWRGMATLEPQPTSLTSVQPKAVRIKVTFARERDKKLERIITRIVYVTLGSLDPQPEGQDSPSALAVEKADSEVAPDEIQPDAEPLANALIAEEDLMPLPAPNEGKSYWQLVSHMISRSWGQHVRVVRRSAVRETVRVRFKLFPSGRAQLIEIEKGSGTRQIDEAGIQAVVHAQPFPPLPTGMGTDAVDVHVRMRTGARAKVREAQTVTSPVQDKSPATVSARQK